MADKVRPGVREGLKAGSADDTIPVIVRFIRRPVPHGRLLIAGMAESRVYRRVPVASMQVSAKGLRWLEKDPEVVAIWPDIPMYAMLDVSAPKIRAPQVWAEKGRGAGVRVAIVDTGIDAAHPDFTGRVADAVSFCGSSAADGNGHGTHVAGIIAGSGASSDGRYMGIAPEATIYAAKVLRDNGSGMMSDVMAGLEWAVEQGVQVINLSLGSDQRGDGTDPLSELCDAAVGEGIVVCVASGNAGPRDGTVGTPGCARLPITIGATDNSDRVASFSSRGPTEDGRAKPDVLLPGVEIRACRAHGTNMGTPVGDYYTQASGTSMATPMASGVVALLLESRPTITPAQVKTIFAAASVDLGLDENIQGAGRVDAYAALTGENPPPGPPPQPPTPPMPGGCLTLPMILLGVR